MSKEKITPNDEAVTGALATILKDSLLVSTKDFQSKLGNSILVNAPISLKEITVLNNKVTTKTKKTTKKDASDILSVTKKYKDLPLLLIGGTPEEKGLISHIMNLNTMYQTETRSTCERLIHSYDKFINDMAKKWTCIVNLITDIKKIDDSNRVHSIIFERGSAWVVRDFKKSLVVDEGHVTSGGSRSTREEIQIQKYKNPLCKIKSIYLDIFSDRIDSSSLYIRTSEGRHPNAHDAGTDRNSPAVDKDFVNPVCTGSLTGQKIYINNIKSIRSILDIVEQQYSKAGLDSPFYRPDREVKKTTSQKVNTWSVE